MGWFFWRFKKGKSLERVASRFSAKSSKRSCKFSFSRTSENVSEKDSEELSLKSPKPIASKVSVKQLEKMFMELECPVCRHTCVPPIETCKNGHMICPTCRAVTSACPTCHEPFAGSRNVFAENFINQYGKPCRFKEQGCCYIRWKGENMSGHESSCKYRNVDCCVPFCGKNMPFRSLLEHMKAEHNIGGGDKLPMVISYDVVEPITMSRKWLPYYIEHFGQVFFLMMEVVRPSFYIWVWVQELQKDHFKDVVYGVSLKLIGGCNGLVYKWEGPVHNIRTLSETIKKEGLCFILPECAMQHFEQDRKISLALNITKKVVGKEASEQTHLMVAEAPKVKAHHSSTVNLKRSLSRFGTASSAFHGKCEKEFGEDSAEGHLLEPTAPPTKIYPNCGDFPSVDGLAMVNDKDKEQFVMHQV